MNPNNWSQVSPSLLRLSEEIWNYGRDTRSSGAAVSESKFTSLAHMKCRCKGDSAAAPAPVAAPVQAAPKPDYSKLVACFKSLGEAVSSGQFGEAGWQNLVSEIAGHSGASAVFVVDAHGLVITSHGDLDHELIEEKGSRLILAFEQIESLVTESTKTLALNIQAEGSNANCWPVLAEEQSYFVIVLSESLLPRSFNEMMARECQALSGSASEKTDG